jgi:nucleoside-diphosphate-sugar epimerase
MQIGVTGGNGDLGRVLIPHLLAQGHAVVSLDRALPSQPPNAAPGRLAYKVADVRSFGEVVASLAGCEAVIHLAAHRSPGGAPDHLVYNENTAGSYNILSAAATLGIQRVCLASSINAIGGVFSRAPRYDYFPVDERHPTYAEDPYSLSKWVLEQQGDAFARRFPSMRLSSLRFHWILPTRARAIEISGGAVMSAMATRHLWAYTLTAEAARTCLLAVTADFTGHEVFYIVAPTTVAAQPSLELARQYYPQTPLRADLPGQAGFFNCAKAEQLLGWRHQE